MIITSSRAWQVVTSRGCFTVQNPRQPCKMAGKQSPDLTRQVSGDVREESRCCRP